MAEISLDDCTVTVIAPGGKIVKIVTPATANDGDTIDCSTLFNNGCFAIVTEETDGIALGVATSYSTTITLPGDTDGVARTIIAIGD